MTYIAQNEYAALYVPARFLPQVNPRYTEVLLWLASHIHDEARHVEVFTKRALAGGARAHALASTDLSLHSLLEESDFSSAALLLNVLGEGTFLDLLRFVERHAPDAATAAAARLAHRDERRHVQFGIAHMRRRLALRSRRAACTHCRGRSASRKTHEPLWPKSPGNRVTDPDGSPLAPARRPLRSRRRAPPTAAGDGAEPHTAPARRRLRRANRAPSLGHAHTESDVNHRAWALAAAPQASRTPPHATARPNAEGHGAATVASSIAKDAYSSSSGQRQRTAKRERSRSGRCTDVTRLVHCFATGALRGHGSPGWGRTARSATVGGIRLAAARIRVKGTTG